MTVPKETWRVARVARDHGATIQEITDAINEGREDTVSQSLVLREVTKPRTEDRPTLEEFAAQRATNGRAVAVWVEGDPSARVSGRATARHVAMLLTDEESSVVEPQKADADVAPGDTLLLTFNSTEYAEFDEVRRKLDDRHVHESNVVVHGPEIPDSLKVLLGAHVETFGIDEPVVVTRYKHQPFENETYEIKLDGLTEGDDAE